MQSEQKHIISIRCPVCQSSLTYYRLKTDDHFCRNCGQPFKREAPLFDMSGLSDRPGENVPEE